MVRNIRDYGRYYRQVAKVSIHAVPLTSTGTGTDHTSGSSSLAVCRGITFNVSVQERYKVLGGTSDMMRWREWIARDEKDDYDGDGIEQRLVLVRESVGETMEGVYEFPKVLFSSSTPASDREFWFRDMILEVMSTAVQADRLDMEKTYESVCREVVDWIEDNLDSLERFLIDQVDVEVDVLSREIEDFYTDEEVDELHFQNCLIESALTPITIENDHDMQQQVDDEGNRCSICMGGKQNNAVQLRCSHAFHKPCIARWLQQKTSCPMCRFQVIRYGDEAIEN